MTSASRARLRALVLVGSVALLARLAALPFAGSDGGDAASRVWIAQHWMEHPTLITEGVWGPLHFYLLALVMWIIPDPVYGPTVLGVVLSSASALLMYRFVEIELGDSRLALVVALAYALYPIGIRNGLSVRSETPFAFFLLVTMIALARARQPDGTWRHAVIAGIALTLGAMLRYEAWMLLPLLAAVLWRKPTLALLFVVVALIHPVFWMIGNAVQQGNPFFSLTAASEFELHAMGRSSLGWRTLLVRAVTYPGIVLRGMGLVVGIIALAGVLRALGTRQRVAIWLIPPGVLIVLQCLAILRGSLVPKINYTETTGTLLMPFVAVALQPLRLARWSAPRLVRFAVAVLAANAIFACEACLARVKLRGLAMSPVPRIPNQNVALRLVPLISANLPQGGGLISDDYGTGATRHVALLARIRPERMFLVCHLAHRPPDADSLAAFASLYPHGLLLVRSTSSFSSDYGFAPGASSGRFGDVTITLAPVGALDWPGRRPARLSLFRYSVVDPEVHPPMRVEDGLWRAPGCSPSTTAHMRRYNEDDDGE
jgi:hypothetical protein